MHLGGRFLHIDSRGTILGQLAWSLEVEARFCTHTQHSRTYGVGTIVLLHGGYYYSEYILDCSVFRRLGCRPRAEYRFRPFFIGVGLATYSWERDGPLAANLQRNGRCQDCTQQVVKPEKEC
jgi:hypothetical protein